MMVQESNLLGIARPLWGTFKGQSTMLTNHRKPLGDLTPHRGTKN